MALLTANELRRAVKNATWIATKKKPNGFETTVRDVSFILWRDPNPYIHFWERSWLLAQREGSDIGSATGFWMDQLYDQVAVDVGHADTEKKAKKTADQAAAIAAAEAREAAAAQTQANAARSALFGR